jgi:hypothetical protein
VVSDDGNAEATEAQHRQDDLHRFPHENAR